MERSSKRLQSRHPQEEGNDEWYEDSKKPAKKSRCSVRYYKTSGVVIEESSTLPIDTFMVVLEFIDSRVRYYLTFLFFSYQ